MNRSPDPAAALRWEDAQQRIAARIEPLAERESVALVAAPGRILADDLVAPCDVPPHDNAAMDGYAVRGAPPPGGYRVVGAAYAGHPHEPPLDDGAAVRIATGAMIPTAADAVIPSEQATADGDAMTPTAPPHAGQHIRRAGEDLAKGAVAIARGRRLTPSDLGLAASLGIDRLDVVRRPRVAVFSTGDELRGPGEPLAPGMVRDSNRYTLMALLSGLAVEVVDLGVARDDAGALEAMLARVDASDVDAVVTSGGVSVGDADRVRRVVASRGRVDFWSLAIKPGRPMAFGQLASSRARPTLLFGLPGNPVAVMTVFHALVRDALLKLMGADPVPLPMWTATCDAPLSKTRGRTEFVRGVAHRVDDGWRVRATADQGAGILRSMSEANCVIVLEHDRGPVAAGEIVAAWPLHGLL